MANLLVYPGNRLIVRRSPTFIKAILLAGVAACVLQLTGMVLVSWLARERTPMEVLQFVASGICGANAFTEGARSVVAGLFLHCMFSLVVAAVYLTAYSLFRFVRRHPFRSGLLYGVITWLVMYGAVIPLSHATVQAPDPLMGMLTLLINMLMVGIPVALATHFTYEVHKRHAPDITELIWHT
ncbi:hypothetical protein MKQ70_07120 [Chitinophaga sedimenti]|uniref:hypothetical protein n=1 Tax=Chitinophaga sedimenti TaxID=2033606 RepID=UPI002006CF15|nr:hypothetical protein [Chitinophaga sedimenti]MCK7554783.1 hypothetical protein [Chitinophaga sedimenti]